MCAILLIATKSFYGYEPQQKTFSRVYRKHFFSRDITNSVFFFAFVDFMWSLGALPDGEYDIYIFFIT